MSQFAAANRTLGGESRARGRPSKILQAAFVWIVSAIGSLAQPVHAAGSEVISDVAISRPFFNPSLGQRIGISFNLARRGSLDAFILDRDGYLVRRLVSSKPIEKGKQTLDWDGRDDIGEIVPDEAYSLKIDLASSDGPSSYFPANAKPLEIEEGKPTYNRRDGVLGYKLPHPARVHLQAGSARRDPKTNEEVGPVLKTIVNREPRSAGSIVENWNGLDESGTIYVPDLPNFVVAIAATTLPVNAIVTVGNRRSNFPGYVKRRLGSSLLTRRVSNHSHHDGLAALEDTAPRLRLTAEYVDPKDPLPVIHGGQIKIRVFLEGPSAEAFFQQPGGIVVFIDEAPVQQTNELARPIELDVPLRALAPGVHRLTVNWVSEYGPVAVNSMRFQIGSSAARSALGSKR